MKLLQTAIIHILNPFYRMTRGMSEKKRNRGITVCCFLFAVYYVLFFSRSLRPLFRQSYSATYAIGVVILIFLILYSNDRVIKHVKWNNMLFYSCFFTGLGMIIISLIHPIGEGYVGLALLLMFGFPTLYLVWNNRRDYETLFNRFAAAFCFVGLIFFIYCIYLAKHGQFEAAIVGRYRGSLLDPNLLSMIGMVMSCMTPYMLIVNRQSTAWYLLTAVSFGTGYSLVLLGGSRLSVLAVLGGLISFTVFYIKTGRDFEFATSIVMRLLRTEGLLLVLIVSVVIGNSLPNINANVNNMETAKIEVSEETEKSDEMNNEEETEEVVADVPQNEENKAIVPAEKPKGLERFKFDGGGLDMYTSGRIRLWKAYAQFFNMTGNNTDEMDWGILTNNTVRHAHNNFVEMAYRCGVPVAFLHTFTELIAGIMCLIILFDKRYRKPQYLFSIVFMIMYTVQSLFDIATIPFERHAPFLFYIALTPLMGMHKNKELESNGRYKYTENID